MEQLVMLIQKKMLMKEERLKQLVRTIDRKILNKQQHQKSYAFFRMKTCKSPQRNHVRVLSEGDIQDHGDINMTLSTLKQARQTLHQLSNYSLVQLEIIKKEQLTRLLSILHNQVHMRMMHSFYSIIKRTREARVVPQFRYLAYKLTKYYKLQVVLRLFYLNRKHVQSIEISKQQAISTFIHRIHSRMTNAFYQWLQQKQNNDEVQVMLFGKKEAQFQLHMEPSMKLEHSFQLVQTLNSLRFKRVSSMFIELKYFLPKPATNHQLYYLVNVFQNKKQKYGVELFQQLKQLHSSGQSNHLEALIKNSTVLSAKLNNVCNAINFKYHKKRRQCLLMILIQRYQEDQQRNKQMMLQQWKKCLPSWQFGQRLRIIDQSQQLEGDQELLIQQYKQTQNENCDLQNMIEQVQTYFHTPTEFSLKKPDQLQSVCQVAPNQEEENFANEDYSVQFVENIENQNMEYKHKIQEQEQTRKSYLQSYEEAKQSLLNQIQQKRQVLLPQ